MSFIEFHSRTGKGLAIDVDEDPIIGVVETSGSCILTMKSGRKEEVSESYKEAMDLICGPPNGGEDEEKEVVVE